MLPPSSFVCFLSQALAKFSRAFHKVQPGLSRTLPFPPSDLDKSEAWKQGNPDVPGYEAEQWGAPHVSSLHPLVIIVCLWYYQCSSDLLLWLLKVLAQWPSSSVWGCFCLHLDHKAPGPQALSAQKVGLLDGQPELKMYCPKSTNFFVEFLGWGWPSVSIEDLIGRIVLAEMFSPYCQLHQNDSHLPYVIFDFYF